jgi:hypothetical protein
VLFRKYQADQIKKDETGHVARMPDMKNAYKILEENSEMRKKLGATKCRRKNNIKSDSKETGHEGLDCIHILSDRWVLPNMLMNFRVS